MIGFPPPLPVPGSAGEQLIDVPECLELEGISAGVMEEHCHLLARKAREAQVGLDDERHAGSANALGKHVEILPWQDDAEVRNGNVMAIDRIMMRTIPGWSEMRNDLMAEQIEVDPFIAAAPLGAAQDLSIEDRKSVV